MALQPLSYVRVALNEFSNKTRMKTTISSKAFYNITDRQTDKIFTEQMLICKMNVHKQKLDLYLNQRLRKSRFPLNVVDGYTNIRKDICIYRGASLLKMCNYRLVTKRRMTISISSEALWNYYKNIWFKIKDKKST